MSKQSLAIGLREVFLPTNLERPLPPHPVPYPNYFLISRSEEWDYLIEGKVGPTGYGRYTELKEMLPITFFTLNTFVLCKEFLSSSFLWSLGPNSIFNISSTVDEMTNRKPSLVKSNRRYLTVKVYSKCTFPGSNRWQ